MDHHIIGHNVGIRPSRKSGVRVEKEHRNEEKIVHAYGRLRSIVRETFQCSLYLTNPGIANRGYIFSFGIARAARDLVEEFLFPFPTATL